jgi:acyl carrier protein
VQLNNIAYIHATPQLLRLLCAGAKEGETLPHLCYVFSGGDALRISHVSELRKLANRIKVVNFYGTTETPQAMAFYEVKPNDLADPIPIGSGIDDVNVIVLNNELKSAEVGEIGQIGIETEYLSNGYLNDESLTSGKFITLSDQEHSDKNIYLTGDNGMRLSDGSIVIKGRIDDQVKIRGFRVELGEIVSALENQAEVSSAAISVQLAQNGENFLVAYLVKANASEASDDSINKLKTSLITQIPAYMIPNHYVWLDALPLLPNGKLDRAKLPKIELTSVLDSNEENIESRSNKDFLIKQWEIILNISNIDTQKSFVNLGGDSLSFIQASIAIEKNIGWLPDNWEKMPLKDINALPKKLGEKFKQVGMPIFFRALSIVLVVAGHYDILMITGSTTALFVVAGWSFGKYQIPTILQENRVKSVYLTILKIAIPTFCATLLKLLLGIKSYWWSLLLIANNFKSNKEQLAEYWFLLVLMQCLFAIAILFSFKRVRELVKENEYRFLIIATLITITLGLIGSQLFDSYALIQRVIYLKIWLVFLGMSIAFANTLEKKLTITAIAVASFVGVWFVGEEYPWFDRQPFLHPWVNHDNFMWFPLVSIFALLFISRIKIPQKIATVVYLLAESSLMIYLTNNFIQKIIKSFYPNTDSFILLFAGLVLGVVFWKIWEKISNPLWKYLDKILTKVNL